MYDRDTRRMYVIGEANPTDPATRVTFAHEFTHALQDQHFDLNKVDPAPSDDDDRSAAVQALIEGDATLTMAVYARQELTARERSVYAREQGDGANFKDAPLAVREQLLFPYEEGLDFAIALQKQGGNAALDAAFADPPTSTEQIIHPDKYLAHEAPVAVSLPDVAAALGDGWQQTEANTLGELDLREMVEQFTDRKTADRAAAGWGGARYALLEKGPAAAIAIRTTWDTAPDAQEFFDAYKRAMGNRYGTQARVLTDQADRHALAGPDFAALLSLSGQDVVLVLAPDQPVMDTIGRTVLGES
jgi:hypothetical protein